jgi:hypothetical protein
VLEFVEEALDEIAFAIEREVAIPRRFAVGFWGNHRGDAWKASSSAREARSLTLFLLTATPFLHEGGIFDFRIDFSAFCIFGIWTGTVLASGVFQKRSVSLLAGMVAGWLVLTRFITFVYLGAIIGILVSVFALGWIVRNDPLMKKRCLNAVLSGVILAAVSAPFLSINAQVIYTLTH